jgi:hypothetical protein
MLEILEDRTVPTGIPLSPTTWTAIGPAPITNGQTNGLPSPVSGRITSIAADPSNANIIYAGAASGGVWKTTNAGTSWTPLTDTQSILSNGAIAVAPSSPSTIYAGTGESSLSNDSLYGRGVLKSTDGGATWTLLGNSVFNYESIAKIVVDPANANNVYVAASVAGLNGVGTGNIGVWKSINGGTTWTNTTAGVPNINIYFDAFSDLVIDPSNSQTLYTSEWSPFQDNNGAAGLYKTVNGGATWTLLGGGAPSGFGVGRESLAISKSSPQTIYAAFATPGFSGNLLEMMVSTNGGTSWTKLANTPNYFGFGQGWYDNVLAVDPSNANTVYAGGSYNGGAPGLIQTTNGGSSWTDIGTNANFTGGVHSDSHAMAFDANGKLLEGDDGGIFQLANPTVRSIQWNDLNTNLQITQYIGVALHPTSPNIAFGGSQDNGTSEFTGSLGWSMSIGGDGGYVRIDSTNPNTTYHTYYYGNYPFLERSDNSGLTWLPKVNGINTADPGNFYVPYVMDPSNSSRLLLGTDNLYETTNKGDLWTKLGTFTFPGPIDSIGVAASNSNTIYVSAAGQEYVTTNRGMSWTTIDPVPSPPFGYAYLHYTDIRVDPTNSQVAYTVAYEFNSITGGGHVWKTTNGGATWTNISGNLPDVPTKSIVVDPRDGVYYIGTDTGVYASNNGGASWSIFQGGLPAVESYDLELNPTENLLADGTHGRGMWEIDTTHFNVTASATSVTAGSGFNMTVTALDGFGNTMTGYQGTVHFSSTDGKAGLPVDYPFTAADNGVHTFVDVLLKIAGPQTITVADTVNASIAATVNFTVSPAAAFKFILNAPGSNTAGNPFTITVTALDAYNNTATGYTGTVHFSSSDNQAGLPIDYTFSGTDAGVHTFVNNVTLKTAGSQTITAADKTSSSISGTAMVSVNTAGLFKFGVRADGNSKAGAPLTVTVTALDQYDNLITSYTGTVHFSSSDSQASLPNDYTFTAGDAGVHTFASAVMLKTAGLQTVTSNDTSMPSINGNTVVTVSAAAPSQLTVTAPGTITVGVPFTVTVTGLDAYNNTVTTYSGTIHFSSSDMLAGLPVDYTFTATDAGVHTFTNQVTLKTSGSQSVTATDTSTPWIHNGGTLGGGHTITTIDKNPNLITGSATVLVSAGAARRFHYGPPVAAVAGHPWKVTIAALDGYGNVAAAYVGTVHFSSSNGAVGLPGDYIFVAGDHGQHTFVATLTTVGSWTISLTDTKQNTLTGKVVIAVAAAARRMTAVVSPVAAWTPAALDALFGVGAHGGIALDAY